MTRDHINLPFPPSVNQLWRSVNGRNIRSKEYRRWRDEALYWLAPQRRHFIHNGPVSITLTARPNDNRRRDLDNLAKPVIDILVTGGVIERDDWKILRRITIERGENTTSDTGLVEVRISQFH